MPQLAGPRLGAAIRTRPHQTLPHPAGQQRNTAMSLSRPRIYRVTYRTSDGRLIKTLTKVPYSGLYGLTETLTRALSVGDIQMFSLTPAKPKEITPSIRSRLERWPEALKSTTERSGVTWLK